MISRALRPHADELPRNRQLSRTVKPQGLAGSLAHPFTWPSVGRRPSPASRRRRRSALAHSGSAVTADRWQASRVDVSEGTAQTYRVALGRLLPRLGDRAVESITAQTVAELVGELHAAGLKKQTIRKTVSVLAMVLDHGRVKPNPARDKLTVKLPREERRQLEPPTAAGLHRRRSCISGCWSLCRGRTVFRAAGVSGVRRRPLPNGAYACLQRRRCADVLAARFAPSPCLAAASGGGCRGPGSASRSAMTIL
jgi:Phage integrase, N-terminal SAM-like domain